MHRNVRIVTLAGMAHLGWLLGAVPAFAADPPPAAPLQVPGDIGFTWGGYFQAIGLMFLVLGALWGVVWLLRRSGRFAGVARPGDLPRGALRLEGQLPLGPRRGLMVVRFLNKRLLLAVTEQRISLLTEMELPHESQPSFQSCLDDAPDESPDESPDSGPRASDQ